MVRYWFKLWINASFVVGILKFWLNLKGFDWEMASSSTVISRNLKMYRKLQEYSLKLISSVAVVSFVGTNLFFMYTEYAVYYMPIDSW